MGRDGVRGGSLCVGLQSTSCHQGVLCLQRSAVNLDIPQLNMDIPSLSLSRPVVPFGGGFSSCCSLRLSVLIAVAKSICLPQRIQCLVLPSELIVSSHSPPTLQAQQTGLAAPPSAGQAAQRVLHTQPCPCCPAEHVRVDSSVSTQLKS